MITYKIYMTGKDFLCLINELRFYFVIEVHKWNIKCPTKGWEIIKFPDTNLITHEFEFRTNGFDNWESFKKFITDKKLEGITWN